MKKILTDLNGGIFGPFTTVEQVENGYLCDNTSYQTVVTGEVIVSEVSDDYTIPQPDHVPTPTIKKPTLEDLQAQIDALKTGA
jgi:hypothetical protein